MSLLLSAQNVAERRVYYLDCSGSMKTLGIWDSVRANLKNAIDNVNDESTELIVIPFTDRKPGHFPLPVYQRCADAAGKAFLKEQIDKFVCQNLCNTVHWVPLEDFYKNRVDSKKVTYMFLMTDGQNTLEKPQFNSGLGEWQARFGDKNVYGFYVMLNKAAKNQEVEHIIDGQEHLWKVETANINISLIRLERSVVFNVRNDQYVEIPIYGDTKGTKLEVRMDDNDYYAMSETEQTENALRVYVKEKMPREQLPQDVRIQLRVSMSGKPQFTYIVPENISVTCKNKKEYTLKVTVK